MSVALEKVARVSKLPLIGSVLPHIAENTAVRAFSGQVVQRFGKRKV